VEANKSTVVQPSSMAPNLSVSMPTLPASSSIVTVPPATPKGMRHY